jgi:hypothetical protein
VQHHLHAFTLQGSQLIAEFIATPPALYDKEPEKHPGVKNLGDMLIALAELKPKVGPVGACSFWDGHDLRVMRSKKGCVLILI